MPLSSADPNAFVALGMQSALGTPQVTASKLRYAKYRSGTDVQPNMQVEFLREGGDGLDFGYVYKSRQTVEGQIVANARPEFLGQLLSIAVGGATWDGGSAPAIHTFHTQHASYPWATLLVQHPGSAIPQIVSDVRFRSVEAVFGDGNNPIQITAPFIGITHAATFTALVPTYYGDAPWVYADTPSYQLDGAADTDIIGFTLSQELGLEELQAQAVTLDEIVVQNRDHALEVRRRFEDPTLWKKIAMGGGFAPTTSVATGAFRGKVAYGAGAGLRLFEAFLPLLGYQGNSIGELNPDGQTVIETITAKPLKGASGVAIYSLQNVHASAYAP